MVASAVEGQLVRQWLDCRDDCLYDSHCTYGWSRARRCIRFSVFDVVHRSRPSRVRVFPSNHSLFSSYCESLCDDCAALSVDIWRDSRNHTRVGFGAISDDCAAGTWLLESTCSDVELVV